MFDEWFESIKNWFTHRKVTLYENYLEEINFTNITCWFIKVSNSSKNSGNSNGNSNKSYNTTAKNNHHRFYYFDQYQANNDNIPNLAFSCDLINTNSKV